jgi:hypothetical protein
VTGADTALVIKDRAKRVIPPGKVEDNCTDTVAEVAEHGTPKKSTPVVDTPWNIDPTSSDES